MKVVVTGTSQGIGKAIAEVLLMNGHTVYGLDICAMPETLKEYPSYYHYIVNVADKKSLPDFPAVHGLVNNAGVAYPGNDLRNIEVNLLGAINCTEKYALQPSICSVVNIVSVSAHNGAEHPLYGASKGGLLTYTKWVAQEIAKYGAVCNSVSPGGVYTDMNATILNNPEKLAAVHAETLLGKWAQPEEVADLVYYLLFFNKSITAQDIVIDNGEMAKYNFIQ